MKLLRFRHNGKASYGVVHEGSRIEICDIGFRPTGESLEIGAKEILPLVSPSKIVCVGRNYADHAKELGNEIPDEPLLFLKAPSAVTGPGSSIIIPKRSERVEHEAELAIVMRRRCTGLLDGDDPFDFVLGYTCLNDVTARDLQKKDIQFTRAKSFDSFCPIGPHIETELDVSDIAVACRVNGSVRQQGRTSQMIFPVDFLIRYISRQMTLEAGDVIATGTPSGVSKMEPGDNCEVEIEGIGTLSNPVMSAAELSTPARG
ncbi:MAG TPA: fumarylacetoacetate hydrolase family protein [Pyrinomonadaceae bacterium]|nr:fumarylacetoacetate hydrolase family protein [Pyrinomonadaceae bacterium]